MIKACDQCVCSGKSNRLEMLRPDGMGDILERCQYACMDNPKCMGIEYWSGNDTCYGCLSPKSYISFADKNDPGFPPSVYKIGEEIYEALYQY